MGPKVEAACRFVEATGQRAMIGRIEDAPAMIEGSRGTTVEAAGPARPTAVSTPGQAPGPAPGA
jgi:carbamate kinase